MRQRLPKSRVGIRHANPKRRARAFAESFHSHERCNWVSDRGCIICGCHAVNAHIPSHSGMGKRGPYTAIVPLCNVHLRELDEGDGMPAFEAKYRVNLAALAAATETAWQKHHSPYRSEP